MCCKYFLLCAFFQLAITQEFYFPDDALLSSSSRINTSIKLSELRGTSIYEETVDKIIASGILKLTLAIDKVLVTNQQELNNFVYAPVGITSALALVLLGSSGKTFEEISTVLGLASGVDIQSKPQLVHHHLARIFTKLEKTSGFMLGSQVNFASAIFVQEDFPIRRTYRHASESIYRSEVLNLDFKHNAITAQNVINAWVTDRTNAKIRSILTEPPPATTKVIIASALYFKAEWEKPFFDGTTKRKLFYPNGRNSNSNIMVEMMSNGGTFPYYKDTKLNCEILGFPYKGNHSTMYVILPNQSNTRKLRELEQLLTASEIEELVNKTRYTGAVVLFPKMTIESTIDLRSTLYTLGVQSLFNPAQANLALLSPGMGLKNGNDAENVPIAVSADMGSVLIFNRMGDTVNCTDFLFPENNAKICHQENIYYRGGKRRRKRRKAAEITDTLVNPGLYADKVLHKVYMDITETGTEAAAVTSVSLSRDGGRVTFRVDVPFIFFILHEETKTVLFWGSVTLPTPHF